MERTKPLLVFALCGLGLALGFSSPAKAVSFYLDATANVGVGFTGLPTDSSTGPMGTTTVGLTAALCLWKDRILLGATSDYRFITEYGQPVSGVSNYRGSYFNLVSPTLGIKIKRFLFKFDYKFLGSYPLLNPTISGQKLVYGSPSGFRGEVIFVWKPFLGIGLFYDSMSFGTRTLDDAPNSTSPLKAWQAGIVVSFLFDTPSQKFLAQKFRGKGSY